MKLEIPIWVQASRLEYGDHHYEVCLLFTPHIKAGGASLERAITRLRRLVRDVVSRLGKEMRHEQLARFLYRPELREKQLTIEVSLRNRWLKRKLPFVYFRQQDRWIGFSPVHDEWWFDFEKESDLATRANEVLSAEYRKLEKEDEDAFELSRFIDDRGTKWISDIEIDVGIPERKSLGEPDLFAILGMERAMDGETELHKVGRRLRDLFPAELDRAFYRENELAKLNVGLSATDRRPLMIVGHSKVGKTSLIHEAVYQRMSNNKTRNGNKNHIWLVSPQRLISGMSYVGQWETRLLAILKHMDRLDHALYIDDILGMYQAGKTSQSALSVAHVLKPYIERRDVRVLVEATPEELRKLRELDRSLADLFEIISVEEPDQQTVFRILIASQREIEAQNRCQFGLDALPTIWDLQHRFSRANAFPGKGCLALQRMAQRSSDSATINRYRVLTEFRRQTGLPIELLDDNRAVKPKEIEERISERFVGQPEATQAAVDAVCLVKSRLNDVSRPIATFMLVGPTGVGKTQFAKELARYFFGSVDRLLRFDMNQYVSSYNAARLIGDLSHPEGILTSAVRKQPFAVVLFDEIEKAHRDVHDLLLQVLGEGRLTDGLGRTTDFTNTILLLTSNLGTSEAAAALGFGEKESSENQIIKRSVKRFFRPEFVNRLDRIIVFRKLSREQMSDVAHSLINELFQRQGLAMRRCLLDVRKDAIEWLVERGYDPTLGARALKRAIEYHLTNALSDFISSNPRDDEVTSICVFVENDQLKTTAELLTREPAKQGLSGTIETLSRFIERADEQLRLQRPELSFEVGKVRPEQLRYFEIQEQIEDFKSRLHERIEAQQTWQKVKRSRIDAQQSQRRIGSKIENWSKLRPKPGEAKAAADIADYLNDHSVDSTETIESLWERHETLELDAAWINQLLESDPGSFLQQVYLSVSGGTVAGRRLSLVRHMLARLADTCGASYDIFPSELEYLLRGPMLMERLASEVGWHLIWEDDGSLIAFELSVRLARNPIRESLSTEDLNDEAIYDRLDLETALRRNVVVREYQSYHSFVTEMPNPIQLRKLMNRSLPKPPEWSSK